MFMVQAEVEQEAEQEAPLGIGRPAISATTATVTAMAAEVTVATPVMTPSSMGRFAQMALQDLLAGANARTERQCHRAETVMRMSVS